MKMLQAISLTQRALCSATIILSLIGKVHGGTTHTFSEYDDFFTITSKCEDDSGSFKVVLLSGYVKRNATCLWIKQRVDSRCKFDGVKEMCLQTCGQCETTTTTPPTKSPADEDSLSPSQVPTPIATSYDLLDPSNAQPEPFSKAPTNTPTTYYNNHMTTGIVGSTPQENNQAGDESIMTEKTNQNYYIYSFAIGIPVLAIIIALILFVTLRGRKNHDNRGDQQKNQESLVVENFIEDLSVIDNTDNYTLYSMWKNKMKTETESPHYPQSFFDASTIKSNGSWVHRAVLDLDLDFGEGKSVPKHILCQYE